MANSTETTIAQQLRDQGWQLLTAGWPDFLCFKEVDGKVRLAAIEVKSFKSKPSPHQEELLRVLANVMEAYVIEADLYGRVFHETVVKAGQPDGR